MGSYVRLEHADGSKSDPMPIERAAFIVAFTMSGKRPKIIDIEKRESQK